MSDTYTYFADLAGQVTLPQDGILSRVLYRDEQVNVTLFAFDAGQELSEHTAASPAIIQILKGEADLTIGDEAQTGGPGTWIHLPARMPHSLVAKTPLVMLLLLLKAPARSGSGG